MLDLPLLWVNNRLRIKKPLWTILVAALHFLPVDWNDFLNLVHNTKMDIIKRNCFVTKSEFFTFDSRYLGILIPNKISTFWQCLNAEHIIQTMCSPLQKEPHCEPLPADHPHMPRSHQWTPCSLSDLRCKIARSRSTPRQGPWFMNTFSAPRHWQA